MQVEVLNATDFETLPMELTADASDTPKPSFDPIHPKDLKVSDDE